MADPDQPSPLLKMPTYLTDEEVKVISEMSSVMKMKVLSNKFLINIKWLALLRLKRIEFRLHFRRLMQNFHL